MVTLIDYLVGRLLAALDRPLSACARAIACRLLRLAPVDPLMSEGQRLASERDDLIAQGVDPADLDIPLAPESLDDIIRRTKPND